jgi:nucleolar protein 14
VLRVRQKELVQPAQAPPLVALKRVLGGEGSEYLRSVDFRLGVIAAALQLLVQFVKLYAEMPCAPELLMPVAAAVTAMGPQAATAVEALRQLVVTEMAKTLELHTMRAPLLMHKKKAEAARSFNPKFEEEGYVPGRDYDPDRARAEQRKMKKQIKQEEKGAARELRKDNYFLAEEKQKLKDIFDVSLQSIILIMLRIFIIIIINIRDCRTTGSSPRRSRNYHNNHNHQQQSS